MFQRKLIKDGQQVIDAFVCDETGITYRRIFCGMAWPYGNKPGFLAVISEDIRQDFTIPHSPRHFRVLEEFESPNLEELHRVCQKIISDYKLDSILSNRKNPIFKIWIKFDESLDESAVELPHDFKNINMDLVTQLVKKNTGNEKM